MNNMDLPQNIQENELLQAQTHIWNQLFAMINSASLICAVQLDIPGIVHKHGPLMTLEEMAEALGIKKAKTGHLGRFMRILVHSGFFIETDINEAVCYTLAPPSQLLLKDNPLSMATFIQGATAFPFLAGPWTRLGEWFYNDDPTPYYTAYGKTPWSEAGHDQNYNRAFNESMACDSRLIVSVVLKCCKGVFEGLDSLVDVGGGTGTMGLAMIDAFPDLKYTVFDLPHVVAGLEKTENLAYVAGNMFDFIPPTQAVLLKWILHDWNDEDCIKILKKCKEAIPSKDMGGKVIIIDVILNTKSESEDDDKTIIQNQIYWDVQMMVYYDGKERSEKEWVKLFNEAGFTDYKTSPVLGSRSLIQLYP